MLISRANLILKDKLSDDLSDSAYVRLVQAGYSYMDAVEAFVIFDSKANKIRSELHDRALQHFNKLCQQNEIQKNNCQLWRTVLKKQEVLSCPSCSQ